jgi:hypothetical protein
MQGLDLPSWVAGHYFFLVTLYVICINYILLSLIECFCCVLVIFRTDVGGLALNIQLACSNPGSQCKAWI